MMAIKRETWHLGWWRFCLLVIKEVTMLCTQIILEYERQTRLLERIVEELEKINARAEWKANKNLTGWESSLRKDARSLYINKRLLSVEETEEYLGIAPQTLYNRIGWRSRNPFPLKPKRVGRLVKFDREELDAHVASLWYSEQSRPAWGTEYRRSWALGYMVDLT